MAMVPLEKPVTDDLDLRLQRVDLGLRLGFSLRDADAGVEAIAIWVLGAEQGRCARPHVGLASQLAFDLTSEHGGAEGWARTWCVRLAHAAGKRGGDLLPAARELLEQTRAAELTAPSDAASPPRCPDSISIEDAAAPGPADG